MNWVAVGGSVILLIIVAILVKQSLRNKIASWFANRWFGVSILGSAVVVFNALVWLVAGCWNSELFARTALYFALPMLVLVFFKNSESQWVDLFIVLLLWLPVEFSLIKVSEPISKSAYALIKYSAMVFALIAYTAFRNRDFSLDWHFSKEERKALKLVGKMFLILFAVLLPLALTLNFVKFGMSKKIVLAPVILIAIWFAPALVEEIIFRGVIQNFFMQKLGPAGSIAITSIIFGIAHVNNKAGGYNYPNWRYVILATLAGIGYGYVYYKRKKDGSRNALGTAATIHCLVDFVWFIFMKSGG